MGFSALGGTRTPNLLIRRCVAPLVGALDGYSPRKLIGQTTHCKVADFHPLNRTHSEFQQVCPPELAPNLRRALRSISSKSAPSTSSLCVGVPRFVLTDLEWNNRFVRRGKWRAGKGVKMQVRFPWKCQSGCNTIAIRLLVEVRQAPPEYWLWRCDMRVGAHPADLPSSGPHL